MDIKSIQKKHSKISRDLAAVAMKQKPGDIILRNAKLVNVLTALIEDHVDIIIYAGFIAFVGDASKHPVDDSTTVIDVAQKFVIPGLIDSHMHVESSMIDLRSFVSGVLPQGTTTICPDNHEMTNVFGIKAVELFHKTSLDLPVNVFTAMPVCVPSLPGMEDAGAAIGPKEVAEAYEKGWAELQGEQMNFPGVIYGDAKVHEITAEGLKTGKVMTGHYASQDLSDGLNAFIASGMTACHESTSADEAFMKASRGMYVQQRYGSAWLDLPQLVPAFLEHPEMDTRMFTLVTDDVTPLTIAEEGHLVRVLRKAVALGVPPIKAVQMATINGAQALNKAQWIGSVAPGKWADLLIVDDLADFRVRKVIAGGVLVAEDGRLTIDIPSFDYPAWALNSLHVDPIRAEDFRIAAPSDGPVNTRIIRMVPGMVYTKEEFETLKPTNGEITADIEKDLAKLAVFYRHAETVDEAHRKSLALLKGTQLKNGYAYATTVSHDCHNLLIVGTDDEAMALAGNTLRECGGGLTVVKGGEVKALLPLPFAGLMSLKPIREVADGLKRIEEALKEAGCTHVSAEMTISLLGLVVLGELHLSNRGLVRLKDGKPPEFVSLFV